MSIIHLVGGDVIETIINDQCSVRVAICVTSERRSDFMSVDIIKVGVI
jgi:hypothetical protein